jgi:hypothetical protein
MAPMPWPTTAGSWRPLLGPRCPPGGNTLSTGPSVGCRGLMRTLHLYRARASPAAPWWHPHARGSCRSCRRALATSPAPSFACRNSMQSRSQHSCAVVRSGMLCSLALAICNRARLARAVCTSDRL